MRRLFERLRDLAGDDGFTSFQNEVARAFYEALGQGYAKNENEIALVARLVDAAKGMSYGPLTLHAAMLHGTRSYVEFNYLDQPVTRELGDMALLSIVTSGSQRLLQRLTVVQNKKSGGKSWSLDREQLFLLKNFPPFSGNRGIFRGRKEVTFSNRSGCLGSYGLLDAPGEMLFAAAGLVSEFARGKKSVSLTNICAPGELSRRAAAPAWLPLLMMGRRFHPKELFFFLEEWAHLTGMAPGPFARHSDFLGDVHFARDTYDLTRAWTRFSVGEPTCIADVVHNSGADAFANYLLQSAGLGGIASFPGNELFGDRRFDGTVAILAAHLDVGE